MESLTETEIRHVVEQACQFTQERWVSSSSLSRPGITFRRISTKDDWDSVNPLIIDTNIKSRDEEILGIFVTLDSKCIAFCTFFLAYSTWDGRVVFLDRLVVVEEPTLDSSNSAGGHESILSLSLRYTIADIGLKLGCTRFVWQHTADAAAPYHPNIQPDTLHEWLTIRMDRNATARLVEVEKCIRLNQISVLSASNIGEVIETRLKEHNSGPDNNSLGKSKLRLRLATEDDLETIHRLVHGLAVFEKMPDAVHVTQEHYRRDGFPINPTASRPLFYCILLENSETSYVCGMAFVYVAHSLSFGRFVYLEDLLIEEEFRGLGGGKIAMDALVRICVTLDCDNFVWQALDWNAPALNFYAKLGGKVQEGLLTSRFAGDSLHEFCKQRPVHC